MIGIGGLIQPRALGVGYDVIGALLTGHAALSLIVGILTVKTAIWSLSLGSGTSGGVLAPLFMIGGALGALVGHWFPVAFPEFWALLGRAAVVGAAMRAPLTGIVFTLELTNAWPALFPLIIASFAHPPLCHLWTSSPCRRRRSAWVTAEGTGLTPHGSCRHPGRAARCRILARNVGGPV